MSHSMALVFEYQGRIGPAVSILQDAVKAFRDAGDRSSNMAEALGDLAGALAEAGRGAESSNLTDEALGLARGLKNDSLTAGVLESQGDTFFYQGDLKSAKNSYEQGLRLATHSGDKDGVMNARLNLSRVAVSDGRARSAIGDIRALVQQADKEGRRYTAVAASALLAQAMIENQDYATARQELQRVLGRSEKLGLRIEDMRIHYLLGTALKRSGNAADAATQFTESARLLTELSKEQGSEHLAERYDLKPIYAQMK
jgi:tetratricopeptide (TPR) repeat protein